MGRGLRGFGTTGGPLRGGRGPRALETAASVQRPAHVPRRRDAAAELVFATVGARPDLGDILRRANEELGADADVLIGGPQRLINGLEDRLKGRVVERMTWAM